MCLLYYFRVLFLKLDYRQHKRARQPLAYRLLLLLLHGETQKKIWQAPILIGDTIDQITSLLKSFHLLCISQHNKAKRSKFF